MERIMSFMTKLLEKIKPFSEKGPTVLFRIFFLFFVFTVVSCSKPAGEIGAIVQPEDSKLKVFWTDTAAIYAYSIPDNDTVRTDGLSTTMLGSMMDPTFGLTTTSFYTQIMLSVTGHRFGENPMLDSLVLQLRYTGGAYGDTTTMQTAHVYRMEESLYFDSIYYSNIDIPVLPTDYANYSFTPRPRDSTIVGGDTTSPVLRINLSNMTPDLGNYLLNMDTTVMDSNDVFVENFKGLYVTAEAVSQGGALVYFDLLNSRSKMIIYYHNDEEDSLSFDYPITLITKHVSKYEHDFQLGDPDFVAEVVNNDTALGSNKFYAQGAAGVAVILKIPNIQKWTKYGTIALNEAKLVLPGNSEDTLFYAPIKMALAEIQDDGSYGYLPDDGEEHYFGGVYKTSTNSYTFRITRYLQSLISDPDKNNNGLYMIVRGASLYPHRFVFNGNNPVSDTARLHLEITYTDLD